MTKKTYLENAEIEMSEDRVILTTRTAGAPSSPQPQTTYIMPANGETVEGLYSALIEEFTNENGE